MPFGHVIFLFLLENLYQISSNKSMLPTRDFLWLEIQIEFVASSFSFFSQVIKFIKMRNSNVVYVHFKALGSKSQTQNSFFFLWIEVPGN